jgi:hypothetical protein
LKPLFPPEIESQGQKIIVRRGRSIFPSLSPVWVLEHLFGLPSSETVEPNPWTPAGQLAGYLTMILVGHYWNADFFRIFGQDFFTGLLLDLVRNGRLAIRGHKTPAFKEVGPYRCTDPVLEYAWQSGDEKYGIKVNYFDVHRTFGGKASLDDLARTFVGIGKLEGFGESDKADMLKTFQREPARAYAYAILDSVLTLLVKEKMAATDEAMYRKLGFTEFPKLRATQGSRVAEMIVQSIAKAARGSVLLTHKGKSLRSGGEGKISLPKVKTLLRTGSGDYVAEQRSFRFGQQTGQTHGGLLFSRSPTQFFHDAPGMLHDVDLNGCYAHIMGAMSLYAGRPVIHEPGTGGMTLKDAVAFVGEHAAGPDAWIAKVSGKINAWPNVLIPSTKAALTNANYKSRAAKCHVRAIRYGLAFDRYEEARKPSGNTALYTDVVEAGVVAWPTWLMIQALPPQWREEYERLEVDTILFYPKQLVADSGPAFDALVGEHRHGGTPWKATLDMATLRQLIEERLDDEYVALRFDLGALASAMQQERIKAKEDQGPGSAAERGWKVQVNSLYGVQASRDLSVNNVVAVNYVTATARALAFALHLSLNGLQVITDGCTYRRDQVLAGTLADCLGAAADYPINRASYPGPFLDPASIPTEEGFTDWYRQHVKKFFGVNGRDYEELFGLHDLEHKQCGDPPRVAFDGLCCDGSANYLKLVKADEGGWKPAGELKDAFKARSFDAVAKQAVADWVVQTYSADTYDGPPPVTESNQGVPTNFHYVHETESDKSSKAGKHPVGEAHPGDHEETE